MPLGPYWAKTGASLATLAIAGAIADIVGITTTTRSHVPIWPLYVCAALFTVGSLLFFLRPRNTTPTSGTTATTPTSGTTATTPTSGTGDEPHLIQPSHTYQPPIYPGRTFSDSSPAEILKTFEGKTNIQADKLVRPHIGTWLRLTGALSSVDSWNKATESSVVMLDNFRGNTFVLFRFTDEHIAESRLAVLSAGTRVTIVGKIDGITRHWISLTACELESVNKESVY